MVPIQPDPQALDGSMIPEGASNEVMDKKRYMYLGTF